MRKCVCVCVCSTSRACGVGVLTRSRPLAFGRSHCRDHSHTVAAPATVVAWGLGGGWSVRSHLGVLTRWLGDAIEAAVAAEPASEDKVQQDSPAEQQAPTGLEAQAREQLWGAEDEQKLKAAEAGLKAVKDVGGNASLEQKLAQEVIKLMKKRSNSSDPSRLSEIPHQVFECSRRTYVGFLLGSGSETL